MHELVPLMALTIILLHLINHRTLNRKNGVSRKVKGAKEDKEKEEERGF
jgi:hypothetical protein